jgi:hypothetical protein
MVLGFVAGQSREPAQDSYVIRLTKAGPTATVQVQKQTSQCKRIEVVDPNRRTVPTRPESQTETVAYRETILEKGPSGERARHLRRQFDRALRQTDGRAVTLPLQGKTCDIVVRGGQYEFRDTGGGPLPPEVVQALKQEFNSAPAQELNWETILLPARSVRVSETWPLNVEPLIRALGKVSPVQVDAGRSTAWARLTQVYPHEGRRFAVLDAGAELPAKALVQPNGLHLLQPGSHIAIRVRINGCIDGSAEVRTTEVNVQIVGISLAPKLGGTQVTTKTTSECTIQETRRELLPRSFATDSAPFRHSAHIP